MKVSHNTDLCGRCKKQHTHNQGNDHYCRVHGGVSPGCCVSHCDPDEWTWVEGVGPVPKNKTET